MPSWTTRLEVQIGTDGGPPITLSPITSFTTTFGSAITPIHSIEADNVGVIKKPQTMAFTMTIPAIGPGGTPNAMTLYKRAIDGQPFDVALQYLPATTGCTSSCSSEIVILLRLARATLLLGRRRECWTPSLSRPSAGSAQILGEADISSPLMAINLPVLVGVVPLLKVQKYVVAETYKSVSIPASSFVQMVGMTSKTITIDALLVGVERLFRVVLEALAMNTVPGALQATSFLESFVGIPVVSKNFIHLDMQITQLTFTQDNDKRETLTVSITLTNVPRPKKLGGFLPGADIALGIGSAFV